MKSKNIKKLTQKQVDVIDNAATEIKDAVSTACYRMDGNGQYIGETCIDVFNMSDKLQGAPKRKVKRIKTLLAKIQGLQDQVVEECEEIEQWASDFEAQQRHKFIMGI
jgi:hypothetical protein